MKKYCTCRHKTTHAPFSLRMADARPTETDSVDDLAGSETHVRASATEPVELNRQSTCIPGHPVFRVMLRLCTFRGFYVARDSKWLSKPSTRSWTGTVPPACRPAGQWLTNVGWMSNNVPFLFTKMWSGLKMVGGGQWLYSNHRRDLGTVEFRNTKVWLAIFPLLREGNYLNRFRGIETEEDRKAPFPEFSPMKNNHSHSGSGNRGDIVQCTRRGTTGQQGSEGKISNLNKACTVSDAHPTPRLPLSTPSPHSRGEEMQ